MAATIEVPVSRPASPRHRRFPAPITVAVALVLAVTAALILIAVWRGLAPALPASGPERRSSYPTPRRDRPEADHQRPKPSADGRARPRAARPCSLTARAA